MADDASKRIRKVVMLLSDLNPPKDRQEYAKWNERMKQAARSFSEPQVRIAELENLVSLFQELISSLRREVAELEKGEGAR